MTYFKQKFFFRYLPLALSVMILVLAGVVYLILKNNNKTVDAAWYNSSWTYRKAITIDHTKVSGTASSTINSFPILFSVTDSDLKFTGSGGKVASSTGADILFTSADGSTKLDHEIEKYSSTTGETIAWVRIPILSALTDTTLYIYFGNSGAATQANPTGVWDSNFKGVWHLPNGTTLTANDSTSNGINGTLTGTPPPNAAAGQIGGAGNFDGVDDLIALGDNYDFVGQSFTVCAWAYPTGSTSGGYIMGKFDGSAGFYFRRIDSGAGPYDWIAGTDGVGANQLLLTNGVDVNRWQYMCSVIVPTPGTSVLYKDGISVNTITTMTATVDNATSMTIGNRFDSASPRQWEGRLDEVRISNSVRNGDWVKTEYNNQISPSTFFAYGSVGIQNRSASTAGVSLNNRGASGISWYNSSWGYRKQITIDHTKVSGTASSTINSFPILFSVTDSDLKFTGSGGKVASSTGADILFTSADGSTKLDHEIEKYSSTTGETIAWVRIPILSALTDTTLYIYFGNSGAATQANPTGVWDSNFKGVYHMKEDPSISTDCSGGAGTKEVCDSTSNNNDADANGSMASSDLVSGQIDGSLQFNGSSKYVTTPINTQFTDFTACAWFKDPSGADSYERILDKSYSQGFWLGRSATSANTWGGGVKEAGSPYGKFLNLVDGQWHYLCVIRSGTTYTISGEGGALRDTGVVDGTPISVTALEIGHEALAGSYTNAIISEVRVSDLARNSDWIATEYNNQISPSAFYAYGALSVNGRQTSSGSNTAALKIRSGGGSQTPAYVQSSSTVEYFNSDSNVAATFSSNVISGNLIAVYTTWSDDTQTINSIADSCGNNYTLVGSPTDGNTFSAQGAYAKNVTGGSACTVTVTFSGANSNKSIAIHEISGVDTNSPLDGNVGLYTSGGAGTDTISSGNFTTNINGDYIFGAMFSPNQNNATITAGTNFTRRVFNTNNNISLTTQDRIQSTASASTVITFSPSGFSDAIVIGMAFKSGAAAVGSVKFR